jgi:hypothetical protein
VAPIRRLAPALLVAACSSSSAPGGSGHAGDAAPPAEPMVHRPTAAPCTTPRPAGTPQAGAGGGCATDADCTKGTNGRCSYSFPTAQNVCTYDQCAKDSDCGGGNSSVCDCRNITQSGANVCFHGNCVVDSECGAAGWCSPSGTEIPFNCTASVDPGSIGYFCHTPADECTNDSDCTSSTSIPRCVFSVSQAHWTCIAPPCTR